MNAHPNFRKYTWSERIVLRWLWHRYPQFPRFGILYISPDGSWLIEEPSEPDIVYGPVTRHYMELLRKAGEYDKLQR